MQDAMHLFNLAQGPLRTLARHWLCRSLSHTTFRGRAGLNRYCPSCDAAKTNDGRAIAIGRS